MNRFAVLMLLIANSSVAQDLAKLDEIARHHATNDHFMGSVLVARGGETLLSKGYGAADLQWNIPNAPNTKFRIGSVTKQFTAAAILLLQERGKLNIQDPVKRYYADAPASWDQVTLFHLLTHTSGIPSFTSFPEYDAIHVTPKTPAELIALFRDKPLEFAPGEKWNYSNSGYQLLGYVIEKASGERYEDFVRENIFVPLEMKDSGCETSRAIVSRRSTGYVDSASGFLNAGYVDMSVPYAAGALYSTTEDLLRWEQGLFGGKLLGSKSLKVMTTPFKNDYALGIAVHSSSGHRVFEHSGAIDGFSSALVYYPDQKLAIVVLSNVEATAQAMAHDLVAAATGQAVTLRSAVAVPADVLARYVGVYHLRTGLDIAITVEDQQLISQGTGQPKIPLFAESPQRFFAKVLDAQIDFVSDSDGTISRLILHQHGNDAVAPRATPQ